MYEAKVISRNRLIELYGGLNKLYGFSKGDITYSSILVGILPAEEELEVVEWNNGKGPFSMVQLVGVNCNGNNVIVPKELVETKQRPSAMEKFTSVLDRVIGPGHWHYHPEEQRMLLHYPSIQITNSLNYKHTITDLIVGFRISGHRGALIESMLYGLRTSMTDLERASNYNHSHLNSSTGRIQAFCLGSKEFPAYLNTLNKTLSADEFELFLVNLHSYLSWESIEGKPYKLISDIGKGATQSVQYTRSIPSYTGYTSREDDDIDSLARYVIRALVDAPQLVVFTSLGWNLLPINDPAAYFKIEESLYEACSSMIGMARNRYFTTYNKKTGNYESITSNRSDSYIVFDNLSSQWANRLKLRGKIIPTEDTNRDGELIKMPFQQVRNEIIKRVNFYLAKAKQEQRINGERIIISNKAESTTVVEPNQPDRVLAQPVS